MYTGFICSCLEYCSHIWGASPFTFLLDKVELKAICLIGDPSLTLTLDSLSLRCKVASLSLFYGYYFGHCSNKLAACMPPPMGWPHSIHQASFTHNYCVELSNARINWFSDGFFPSASRLWNSLPSVFPASSHPPSFKSRSITIVNRWQDFFFFSYIYINIPFLDTVAVFFITWNWLLFFFLRDTDSRKGAKCPFYVPIHLKKKRKKKDISCNNHGILLKTHPLLHSMVAGMIMHLLVCLMDFVTVKLVRGTMHSH